MEFRKEFSIDFQQKMIERIKKLKQIQRKRKQKAEFQVKSRKTLDNQLFRSKTLISHKLLDLIIKMLYDICSQQYAQNHFQDVLNYYNIFMKKTLFLLGCSIGALGYQTEGSVLKLGESDFDAALNEFPHVLVKFFAPWCGHCKNLAQTYLDSAEALKEAGSTVKLAEVDCTIHKQLCQKHGIRGYPTVNFFSQGTEAPQKYSSSRTKEAIIQWLNERVPIVQAQQQQEAVEEQAEEQEAKEEETQEQAQQQRAEQFKREQNLYQLTTQTFNTAKERFDFLFVKFFAPWCGHCVRMKETWIEFANSNTDPKVAIAQVDCTQNSAVCSENGVQGYPTVKLLVRGNEPVKYQGARTVEAFSSWFQEQKTKFIPGAIPDSVPEVQAQEL